MRPPNENQNGSTRPNFMSASRRAYAGDDNILARLERDAKRGKTGNSGSWKHATLAWCVLASVLVIALIGTLASLARENLTVPKSGAEARPPDQFANSVRGGFAPLPVPSPNRRLGVNIYDVPSEPSVMPPMVTLKSPSPAAKSANRAADAAPAPAPRTAAAKPAKPAPKRLAAARPAPARAVTAAARPASPPRFAAVPARQKKPAPAASQAAESSAVDSDVALLSAIIMHASRHSSERAQMEAASCGAGKKCPPSDSFPSLKATD